MSIRAREVMYYYESDLCFFRSNNIKSRNPFQMHKMQLTTRVYIVMGTNIELTHLYDRLWSVDDVLLCHTFVTSI